ncbi:MAG: Nramp family divalent metal transporter [Actinobacteria bacterium]|nr:Nramp family divalent metal transporter [Actinomycetota bacterium]
MLDPRQTRRPAPVEEDGVPLVDAVAPAQGPPAPPPGVAVVRGLRRLCGPGVVVAVAYVDPGNFATNTEAGASLGVRLLWVVVVASAAAMLVQYLAAKAGSVTGRSLPELCRDRYPKGVNRFLWVQAEIVSMATDVAEVLGAAVALSLLFGLPLPVGGLLAGAFGVGLLALRPQGRRRFEAAVAALLLVVLACYVYQVLTVGAFAGAAAGLQPSLAGQGAALLAAGIVGATVMPHAIYVHSSLASTHRIPLRTHRFDIVASLSAAAFVNVSILLVAATVLSGGRLGEATDTLTAAYEGFGAVGAGMAAAFALALLVAGLAASGVGTLAGDIVMAGFVRRRIPLVTRRLLTLGPAMLVLCLQGSTTQALVLSQVVLSFGVPFALLPLVHITADRALMGRQVNRRLTTVLAVVITLLVCALNVAVISALFTG